VVEGHELGAGPLEGLQVVGVGEAERRPRGHRHARPAGHSWLGKPGDVSLRRGGGEAHHGVEVAARAHGCSQAVERPFQLLPFLRHGDQAQVAVRISVTVSAISMMSAGASRPVTTTLVFGALSRSEATTSAAVTQP